MCSVLALCCCPFSFVGVWPLFVAHPFQTFPYLCLIDIRVFVDVCKISF